MGLRVRWKSRLMCLKNHMYFVQSVISLRLYFYIRNGGKYHILPGTLLSSLYLYSLSLYLSIIYHLSIIYLSIIYLSIIYLSPIICLSPLCTYVYKLSFNPSDNPVENRCLFYTGRNRLSEKTNELMFIQSW